MKVQKVMIAPSPASSTNPKVDMQKGNQGKE